MWRKLASIILSYRVAMLLLVAAVTCFMAEKASHIQIMYQLAKLLPDNDPASVDYDYFKNKFGQDGAVLVIGTEVEPLRKLKNFKAWLALGAKIKKTTGIANVASVCRLKDFVLNDSLGQFEMKNLTNWNPESQEQLNLLWKKIESLKFYDQILINLKKNATVMAVTFNKHDLNTAGRLLITDTLKMYGDQFATATGAEVHYSGMPYIRTNVARKIQGEMTFFMILAVIVTGFVLFIFFRNFTPVIFSLLVVSCGVVFSMGVMVCLGYQLSVLSGLIPPLIIVIGVPNCILILNKYHTEYSRNRDKMKSLFTAIERTSMSLFFANFTTCIGFAVFCAIKNRILFEFGLVSSISVMATYLISLITVPSIFSFLPGPAEKQTKHIEGQMLRKILNTVDAITVSKRKWVYAVTLILSVLGIIGFMQIKAVGYIVDDLPKKDPLLTDLHYFEDRFGGVLPFEITIDTRRENGVFSGNGRALYRINKIQKLISGYPEFSRPVSLVEGVKFLYQSFKNGDPKFYKLPSITEMKKIAEYVPKDEKGKENELLSFLDSSRKVTRISIHTKDIGSVRLDELTKTLKPRIDSVLNFDYESGKWMQENERYEFKMTGSCLLFLKGNEFLVTNLTDSVFLAILLIAAFLFTLFSSPRMILISIVPSLVALLITAGIMGAFHVPLKTSTILVFSIAFGISSDGTLYFLTKYRHELRKNKLSISQAVALTIHETGVSMIYTALILTFGFAMFGFSSFGGTASLGILLAITLIVAYTSNLILLPCFLLSLEKGILKKEILNIPLIDINENLED